jgi:hypothetical protein
MSVMPLRDWGSSAGRTAALLHRAIVSAFASSTAILGATIPLAVPFLLAGDVGAVGVIVALAISSTIVDVSPFSANGALVAGRRASTGPSTNRS